jgi:predicted nucleotidyltransferase
MRRPEDLVQALTAALPRGLRSVLLYGSAAAGDHVSGRSDYNILVVLEELDLEVLQAIAPLSRRWQRAGNPAPLLFTPDRLRRSADVFAIEIRDMQERHRVLYGDDQVLDIEVDLADVRRELERELESNLVRLRQGYLLVANRPARVWQLIEGSLSTFLVLIRAALRLYGGPVPGDKLDAVSLLASRLAFDHQAFAELEGLRRRRESPAKADVTPYFARYLRAAEQLLEAVDGLDAPAAPGSARTLR